MLDLATLHDAIAAAVPDRPSLLWGARTRTWRETADRTRRLAGVLHAHGLGRRHDAPDPWRSPHDHLGLYLHNGPEYLEGLVGAHKARVAPFNINYRYVDEELVQLCTDARPAALLFHARFAATLARVLPKLDTRPLLLQVADGSGADLLPDALDYEQALADAAPITLDASPGDLQILYTGGTTGLPKGVLWRIGDLIAGPLALVRRDGTPVEELDEAVERAVRSTARVLVAPPMMHGAGTWSALGAWCGGAPVVLPDRVDGLDADDLLDTAERHAVTRIPLVGDAFARPLLAALKARPRGLPALRTLLNSAAGLGADVRAELAALLPHVRVVDVLGSSESGFAVTRVGDAPFVPSPGTWVLSADRTRRLSPGEDETGWLATGGRLPLGYLGDPARTAATFPVVAGRRVVVAGDRARLCADGTVEVLGREATTINTGGEKVFAEEVEGVLRAVPGVADALVVGRPSERWGTEIVAVLRAGAEPGDAALRDACAARLARYKIPKAFVRTDAGLRLPNGKADYAAARALVDRITFG
ncbi:AMP-binding protein [Actinomadura flavalba]|uniref:AMP-binding protein n=1 Tax=Actinomadura flavalba TaxID=1120938 RepID=UPI00036CBB8A|nr:AMP-binding protein [Actinomadura flavalba]